MVTAYGGRMSIREYLGLTRAELMSGYIRNERAGSMPVCQQCGALVAFESQDRHTAWHEDGSNGHPTH